MYYAGRKITVLASPDDFNRFLAEKCYGELIVLMLKRDLKLLPENLVQEVLAGMLDDAYEATVVARLHDDALIRVIPNAIAVLRRGRSLRPRLPDARGPRQDLAIPCNAGHGL